MRTDLIGQARAGDEEAFRRLVEPYRRELHVHCYRFLGSVQDAEDVLQETLLAAWQGLRSFEERSSIRTWLYRIATNRCLNALRSTARHPQMQGPLYELEIPEPSRQNEVFWLEPYPDSLLQGETGWARGPESHFEASEAISLAFVTALQLLPARQRAVLILRDVLGFHAREVAEMLETSDESVASALRRARTALRRELPGPGREPPPPPNSREEQELVNQLTEAFERCDVDGIVSLLTEDSWLKMPPIPLEYQGRALAHRFFTIVLRGRHLRLVPTRANGQPALGLYLPDPVTNVAHANGVVVLTLEGDKISALTHFDNSVLMALGLPRTLHS